MRAVIQRVRRARVTVEGVQTGAIDGGLLIYLGVAPTDGPAEVDWCARKIAEMRLFSGEPDGDAADRMDRSVEDLATSGSGDGAVLLVSQFTLYADTRRGRRPAFTDAAPPDVAAPLVDASATRCAHAGCASRRAASARTCWSSPRTTAR